MILYNAKHKERSRNLRKSGNLPETLLWQKLQKRQFLGLLFTRQKPIGQYIADFYCHSQKLILEIDGEAHTSPEYDAERDQYMDALGLRVIRIPSHAILKNLDSTLHWLATTLSPTQPTAESQIQATTEFPLS